MLFIDLVVYVTVVTAAVETAVASEAVAVVTWPRVIVPDPVG